MTRLATAQFTGRSSTHAQPPPPSHSHLLSLPLSPHPLSVPPAPSFTSLLYPPSPLNFSQSLPSCCVFSQPLLLSLLSLFLSHCCQQDRNCLLASWRDRSCRPASGDKMSLNTRQSNILIRLVEQVPFVDNKIFLDAEVAFFRDNKIHLCVILHI